MAVTDFSTLRNLAFYYESTPTTPYFYFKSLDTFRYGTAAMAAYDTEAKRIAQIGKQELSSFPSFAEDEDTLVKERFDKIIDFIKKSIEYEKNNEIKYFQLKLKELKQKKLDQVPEVKTMINMLNNPDSFNYKEFISLINIMLQGLENTKAITKYEKQHIEEINNAMDQMYQSSKSQLEGLWKSNYFKRFHGNYKNGESEFLEKAEKKRQRRILMNYTDKGRVYSSDNKKRSQRILGAKKYLENISSTVDVKIARWITEHVLNLINEPDTYNQILTEIQQKFNIQKSSYSELEKAIQSILIKSATAFATAHISEILNDCYNNLSPEELADMLQDSMNLVQNFEIKGLYDNFGVFGNSLELFKNVNQVQDLLLNNAQGLCDAYKKFRTELDRTKKQKQKASTGQILIKQALHTGTTKDEYTEIYRLINFLTTLNKKVKELGEEEAKIWADTKAKSNNFTDKNGDTMKLQISFQDGKIDIQNLSDNLKNTKIWEKLGGANISGETLKGVIMRIKTLTSQSIREDLIQAMNPLLDFAQKKGLGGEQEVLKAIKHSLENIKISVGGPTFNEIKQGIQEEINNSKSFKFWTGKLNRKNDFITVTVTYDGPSLKNSINSMIKAQAKDLADKSDKALKSIEKKYAEELATYFYKELGKLKNTDSEFNSYAKNAEIFFSYNKKRAEVMTNLKNEQTEADKAWKQYYKIAKKKGITDEELNKQREEVLSSLKDSFFVSSTMKAYNQYQNNIGFVGGSLGNDLYSQLDNINQILSAAGLEINQEDINWLYSAIINCSPVSLIGEKNKNIIEDYLGSIAAFALFDEGAAEATIIRALQHNHTMNESNILHLYSVNGVYIPGSYVLTKVLKELEACAENSYRAYESVKRGASITIINPMNENMIPNRGKDIDVTNPPNKNPWGTVSNAAKKNVKLQILFLAGLFDIVRDINDTLSNIELPK